MIDGDRMEQMYSNDDKQITPEQDNYVFWLDVCFLSLFIGISLIGLIWELYLYFRGI